MQLNISQITQRSTRIGAGALALLLCAALLVLVPATSVAQTEQIGSDPTAHQYGDRITERAEHEERALPARVVSTLPVTGADLMVLAGIAGLLVASGVTLRRLATPGG